ncbi:MAG: hypothetical protein LBC64_11060 [Fibromonadaceae bacterium]|nr:hypothetical protein [Fibromonadaceae bacterium]
MKLLLRLAFVSFPSQTVRFAQLFARRTNYGIRSTNYLLKELTTAYVYVSRETFAAVCRRWFFLRAIERSEQREKRINGGGCSTWLRFMFHVKHFAKIIFLHYPMRGKYMGTETAILANETEIANALNVFGLGNFAPGVLDEIELNRRLRISLEQADKGMTRPVEEAVKDILTDLKNGRL